MGYRQRAFKQWPGRGPFSDLPPWQRPGRVFGGRGYGRGAQRCARFPWLPRSWWADPKYAYQLPIPAPNSQEEIASLEESKKALAEEKESIEQEIIDVETHLKELRSKLEREKNQQPSGQ